MSHSPEQSRKKEAAQQEAERHHKYANVEEMGMSRAAEVENQKREDRELEIKGPTRYQFENSKRFGESRFGGAKDIKTGRNF